MFRNLVEQLSKQQQLQRTTPLQVGQTAAVRSQQSGGATAVNREGQGSRTAVSVQVLSNNTYNPSRPKPPPASQLPAVHYTYKVKIINPNKKSVTVVRYLHNVSRKFESVSELRVRLIDELKEHVPSTTSFDVGYFEGKQQSKIWLVTSEDIKKLYDLHPKGGEVLLWCDGASESGSEGRSTKRSKEAESAISKRSQQESEVESTYKELKEKHQESWDTPHLKLWARCIVSGIHDDYDNPQDSPAFSCAAPKRDRKESLSEAIGGAAVAIVKALKSDSEEKAKDSSQSSCALSSGTQSAAGPGVSPGRAVDLRMKNYQQLRYLQQLYEDNILDEKEYVEQKRSILAALRNLD